MARQVPHVLPKVPAMIVRRCAAAALARPAAEEKLCLVDELKILSASRATPTFKQAMDFNCCCGK